MAETDGIRLTDEELATLASDCLHADEDELGYATVSIHAPARGATLHPFYGNQHVKNM